MFRKDDRERVRIARMMIEIATTTEGAVQEKIQATISNFKFLLLSYERLIRISRKYLSPSVSLQWSVGQQQVLSTGGYRTYVFRLIQTRAERNLSRRQCRVLWW